jgi:HD superfamily phosphohydrolase YqeK
MTAGLLHDAAKDLPVGQQMTLLEQAGIPITHPCERLPIYAHAPASACLIRQELGIADPLILDAIATHSFSGDGANFDSPLAWCLRAADVLAPTHDWTGMKRLRAVMFAGKMQEAALLQVGWLIEYFNELDIPIHPTLEKKFNALSAKLGVSNSFFERW